MNEPNLPPLPKPGQISGAPMASYSPEDQAFFRFWYGHMLGDLMQPPLVDVRHATARYIWDAAILAERERYAKVCEDIENAAWKDWKASYHTYDEGRSNGAGECAAAIREGHNGMNKEHE